MERSKDWISQAQGDLAHAQLDLEHGYFDWACFSAQQSAEKAVKAVLKYCGADAWGDSVVDLLVALRASVPVEDRMVDEAQELDKIYISARYPDALPAGAPRDRFTRGEAARMVHYAGDIVELCADRLPRT